MKTYFDMCSLQRPLDDKAQPRVFMEAAAVLRLFELCAAGELQLISSEALRFEASRNPHPIRKSFTEEVLAHARLFIKTDAQVERRAREYTAAGIKPLDALHLASAVEAGARYFCTCDDKLLKKATAVDTSSTTAISPLKLIEELW